MNIDLDLQWQRLMTLTQQMTVTRLNERDQDAHYTMMLNDLRHDHVIGEVTLLGMYRAPASKERHHDFEGGLVYHLLEMWSIWQSMRGIIREHATTHSMLSDENIWRGILHHDLNKVWRYRQVQASTWSVDYAEDRMTALLMAQNKSLWLLSKYSIHLDLPLTNALLCAEGGYAKVRPPVKTVLADVIYMLDETSANVINRLQSGRFWDSKRGGLGET